MFGETGILRLPGAGSRRRRGAGRLDGLPHQKAYVKTVSERTVGMEDILLLLLIFLLTRLLFLVLLFFLSLFLRLPSQVRFQTVATGRHLSARVPAQGQVR